MTNYQYALREDNARKLATRGVNTSFLLFPVRLETKFKEKMVTDIHEPDRVYYAFCAVWAVIRLLKNSPEEKILKKIALLKYELEGLDLIYKEDKGLLRILLTKISDNLHTATLKEAFSPLLAILEDVTVSSTIVDKKVTLLLNKLDKVTRRFNNTVNNPPYNGLPRKMACSGYSHTVFYRTALKNFRECMKFILSLEKEIKALPVGVTKQQVAKFNRIIERLSDLILKTENLLYAYHIDVNKEYILEAPVLPAQERAQKYLCAFVHNEFVPTLSKFDYDSLKKAFGSKFKYQDANNTHPFSPKRYTILASSLMQMYLRNYVCSNNFSEKEGNRKLATLSRNTYFNYRCEKQWTVGLVKAIGAKLNLDIPLNYLNQNDSTIHRSRMDYDVKQKSLCVRIYPDVVALTQVVSPLSLEEFTLAKDFWCKYVFSKDEQYHTSLWLALCDVLKPHRAAYVLKESYGRIKYSELAKLADNFRENGKSLEDFLNNVNDNTALFDSSSLENEQSAFTVPVTDLMPDRFVLNANLKLSSQKRITIWRYGRRLPSQLQVGLDLNNLQDAINEKKSNADGQLYLNGSLRWMTDYDQAERMGMAITLPLKALQKGRKRNNNQRLFDFDSIFVYGIHEAPADECGKILQKLLTSQLYSDTSFGLLDSDMPTNILTFEDDEHKYDSSDEAQKERFKIQPQLCLKPSVSHANDDVYILQRLFGLPEHILNGFDKSNGKPARDIELAKKVNQSMLSILSEENPLIKFLNNNSVLKNFFIEDVLPRGVFPFFRVGSQPYGIVPVCDFRHLSFSRETALHKLKHILLLLTNHWNNIVNNDMVAYDGNNYNNIKDSDYLNILGVTPSSTTFWKRKMISSGLIRSDYFSGEMVKGQLDDITAALATHREDLGESKLKQIVKETLPDYSSIPLLDTEDDKVAKSVIMANENIQFPQLITILRKSITVEEASDEKLRQYIVEFYDLFNYRIDAWLTGLLNHKLRNRIKKGKHSVALGCFGWIFNLKESDSKKAQQNNEYILAPSVNQAIAGAVLRSSYNSSLKNKKRDYDMSINLSSDRVRSAIRIIEGVQNGLSIGCILGSDLERLIHESYKQNSKCELDSCIYPLRTQFPLVSQSKKDNNASEITVLNGASLIKAYRQASDRLTWLKSFQLFNDKNANIKYQALLELIDRIDAQYDALADVILSESVYKLTQGNQDAVDALMQAMDEMKNIPMPDVVNIPVSSAQVDGHMVVALDVDAKSQSDDLLSNVEPKVDLWISQMVGSPSDVGVAFEVTDSSGNTVLDYCTLQDLGISASEMVYLSADTAAFDRFLKTLYFLKVGVYPNVIRSAGASAYTLQEIEMACDDMRQLISGCRMLKNDDMVKETGHTSKASYNTLDSEYSSVYNNLMHLTSRMNEILSLQKQQQDPLNKDYKTAAVDDKLILDSIRLMTICFRAGQLSALDSADSNIFTSKLSIIANNSQWIDTVSRQHNFFSHMNSVYETLVKKLEEAQQMVANSEDKSYTVYKEAIKHLLVADYLIIPSFCPDINVDIEEIKYQCSSNRFANVDYMRLEHFVSDMATVQEQMMHLHQLRMYGKCNDLPVAQMLPLQFPVTTNQSGERQWLGAEVSDESFVKDAFVYMVMDPQNMIGSLGKEQSQLAGIVVDHWIERIPYKNQTAAVAFNYDQPDSEAPQSLLLAVSTKDRKCYWSENMMLNTMKSAVHMVKCRAVTPELLANNSWTGGIFPLVEYKDVKHK